MIHFNYAAEMASICHSNVEFYVFEKDMCLFWFLTILWTFLWVLTYLDHYLKLLLFYSLYVHTCIEKMWFASYE